MRGFNSEAFLYHSANRSPRVKVGGFLYFIRGFKSEGFLITLGGSVGGLNQEAFIVNSRP